MTTCIRPSHKIWLCGEHRFLEPQEALRAHGVYAEEFSDPSAVLNLEPYLALDFAGNAFSTSALIAKILCTMVNAKPWKTLASFIPTSRSGLLGECARNAAKRAHSNHDLGSEGAGIEPEKPPTKRRKTSKASKKRKAEGDPEDPEGGPAPKLDKNKQCRGYNSKGSLLTISKKMEILNRYDELRNTAKHPEKALVVQKKKSWNYINDRINKSIPVDQKCQRYTAITNRSLWYSMYLVPEGSAGCVRKKIQIQDIKAIPQNGIC